MIINSNIITDLKIESLEDLYKLKPFFEDSTLKINKSQQELLLDAVTISKRSYDEIMAFIQSDPTEDIWYEPGQVF